LYLHRHFTGKELHAMNATQQHDAEMVAEHDGGYVHTETYDRLHVAHLTPQMHERTCNYWYTVTSRSTSHVAFTTRAGLDRWLSERGLTLDGDIAAEGDMAWITGSYRDACHIIMPDAFDKIAGLRTYAMSNGNWVTGIITTDADGLRTVHTLNPNIHTRTVYPYFETSALMR
jgi:hypothetical protein